MLPAAEQRISALTSNEEIFSFAVPFAAATSEDRIGENEARGKKPHQGIFSENRSVCISQTRVKWSGTHQLSERWWSKTALGIALDANGNTLTDAAGRSYTWDFENRLTQAVVPGTNGGTTTFKYDPFGRRIYKQSPSFTTAFLYDGVNLVETANGSGSEVASYTQGPGVDQPVAELRSGTAGFYEQDGLGSVTSLSNSAGALANTYTYCYGGDSYIDKTIRFFSLARLPETWKEWVLGGGAKYAYVKALQAGATSAGGAESAGAAAIGVGAEVVGTAGTVTIVVATGDDIVCRYLGGPIEPSPH
jgi:YD repeat-containing protein